METFFLSAKIVFAALVVIFLLWAVIEVASVVDNVLKHKKQ